MVLTATVAGQAAVECEVKLLTPGHETLEATTNQQGQATFPLTMHGRYAVRVRHIDSQPGTLGDKSYAQTKTYATVTVDVAAPDVALSTNDQSSWLICPRL